VICPSAHHPALFLTNTSDAENKEIPKWIKNNAGWWADGQITDSDFVSGIEYLVNHNIITY